MPAIGQRGWNWLSSSRRLTPTNATRLSLWSGSVEAISSGPIGARRSRSARERRESDIAGISAGDSLVAGLSGRRPFRLRSILSRLRGARRTGNLNFSVRTASPQDALAPSRAILILDSRWSSGSFGLLMKRLQNFRHRPAQAVEACPAVAEPRRSSRTLRGVLNQFI